MLTSGAMQLQSQVTVEVTLEPADLYWPFDLGYRLALAVLAAALVFEAWKMWPSYDSNVMLGVAAILAWIFLYPWIKIQYYFRTYPAYRKPRRYSFDAEGLHLQSDNARGDYKWSVFTKVVETKRRFQFMQTDRSGIPIPKRFLTQPDDIPRLRRLIRENFQGTRRLRID
jgi:hypothetical protein